MSRYDALPYAPVAHAHTQPAHLAAVARAHGVAAADPSHARVLELGAASGWNLIPLAERFPDARFVAVDLDADMVRAGRAAVARLALGNLEVVQADLRDVDLTYGTFDYIIVHGVYSWVPGDVRAALRERLAALLAPHGVAFLSFNCFPGWHARGAIAAMMKRHTAGLEPPLARVHAALGFLAFLAEAAPDDDTGWKRRLALELAFLRGTPPTYVFHDHLAEVNAPMWVADVLADLRAHGLAHVGDADPAATSDLAPETLAAIRRLAPSDDAFEQQLDEVVGRTFRKAVVCRAAALTGGPLPALAPVASGPRATGRPEVWRVARLQLELAFERLTNLAHRSVVLRDDVAALVPFLDGARDEAALVDAVARSPMPLKTPEPTLAARREVAAQRVAHALGVLARLDLLVAR